jgi:hypothetical protein
MKEQTNGTNLYKSRAVLFSHQSAWRSEGE